MRKSLMRMTLRQLQIFNEVCDLRSYSRAAEEMYKTPGYGRRLRFVRKCSLVAEDILPVVLRTLFLSSDVVSLLLLLLLFTQREREYTVSTSERYKTHTQTHRQTDRE